MRLTKFAAGAALALSLMGAGGASAAVTYTYVGNGFTQFSDPFTSADYVSGSFTTDEVLAPSLDRVVVSPVEFTFFAGTFTFSGPAGTHSESFQISTATNADISAWFIEACGANSCSTSIRTYSADTLPANDAINDGSGRLSGSYRNPGSWTMSTTTPVPEPATWALVLAGFGLSGAALRQARRRYDLPV